MFIPELMRFVRTILKQLFDRNEEGFS